MWSLRDVFYSWASWAAQVGYLQARGLQQLGYGKSEERTSEYQHVDTDPEAYGPYGRDYENEDENEAENEDENEDETEDETEDYEYHGPLVAYIRLPRRAG